MGFNLVPSNHPHFYRSRHATSECGRAARALTGATLINGGGNFPLTDMDDHRRERLAHNGVLECRAAPSCDACVVVPSTTGPSLYLVALLRQEGLLFDVFEPSKFFSMESWPRVIVLVGPAMLPRHVVSRLGDHVTSGGGLVVIGGPIEPLEGILSIAYEFPLHPFPVGGQHDRSAGEGYARLERPVEGLSALAGWFPLHAFGCWPVVADGAEVLVSYDSVPAPSPAGSLAAVTIARKGSGVAVSLAVDLVTTIRRIQEGLHVDADGIPPADGTAPVDDGILKAEDGLVLDWARDRRPVSSSRVPAFMVPVADAWRRVLMACIELVADETATSVQRAWYWPDGVPFIALISHDSDGNDETLASRLDAEIRSRDLRTTWCLQPPGYRQETCDRLLAWGHELALHFDAISGPDGRALDVASMHERFSFDELASQRDAVARCAGSIYSNKNHYTRWEGRNAFLEWCAQLGIRVDQSKGPSKCGTMGFPFGSCHPWQPLDAAGELVGCAEISFQSQDFGMQGPADVIDDLLDPVALVNGIAHVIFHPAHAGKADVNTAMHRFIDAVLQRGGRFMTSKEIGEWHYNRRLYLAGGIPALPGIVIQARDAITHEWRP